MRRPQGRQFCRFPFRPAVWVPCRFNRHIRHTSQPGKGLDNVTSPVIDRLRRRLVSAGTGFFDLSIRYPKSADDSSGIIAGGKPFGRPHAKGMISTGVGSRVGERSRREWSAMGISYLVGSDDFLFVIETVVT